MLNKLNRQTVIIYKEYEMEDGSFLYSQDTIIYDIPSLLKKLEEYKRQIR